MLNYPQFGAPDALPATSLSPAHLQPPPLINQGLRSRQAARGAAGRLGQSLESVCPALQDHGGLGPFWPTQQPGLV